MFCDGKVCSVYGNRLAMFQPFVRTWQAIDKITDGTDPKSVGLAEAFGNEVMIP